MAANLTQQYYAAEEAYKKASNPEEKIAALEEMLATIPKHKGTEKLQAEIKKRLARMRKEGQTSKSSGGSRQEDPFLIDRQGGGQVFLLGYPNSGKSSLVQVLTNAKTQVAEYPFSTVLPVPAMMAYEDIGIQLVDTPPFVPEGIAGNFSTALRNSDMIALVLDLSDPECMEHIEAMLNYLEEKRILRNEVPQGVRALTPDKILVLGNKVDIVGDEEEVDVIKELMPDCPTILAVSAQTGTNLDQLRRVVYEKLQVLRVYTKKPGKDPDLGRPFILPHGGTVQDLAAYIHKDIADNLKTAKVWGSSKFDGQAVNHDYVLADGDIVELN